VAVKSGERATPASKFWAVKIYPNTFVEAFLSKNAKLRARSKC